MNVIKKDLTTVQSGIVAHGCNCQGGFGSGIAGAISRTWPHVRVEFIKNGEGAHLLGTVDFNSVSETTIVANCYTQEFFGNDGKKYASLDAIEQSVTTVCENAIDTGMDLYIAKIGCGLGGLSWEDEVKPLYEKVFEQYGEQLNVFVCDI